VPVAGRLPVELGQVAFVLEMEMPSPASRFPEFPYGQYNTVLNPETRNPTPWIADGQGINLSFVFDLVQPHSVACGPSLSRHADHRKVASAGGASWDLGGAV
jgi:hypothetical protein